MKAYHLNKPKPDHPVTESPSIPILNARTYRMPWGRYRTQLLWTLPDQYLMDLESGFSRQKWGKPPDDQKFKVSLEIMEMAREALKARGVKKRGERWIR